jgi:hypothetical protein
VRVSKYRAIKTEVDGILFDSKAEARAYCNRKLMQQNGMISGLELQPAYDLIVNGVKVGRYIADFRYTLNSTGAVIVEDVKGVRTPVYRLKKKLMLALYGISILESNGDDIPF